MHSEICKIMADHVPNLTDSPLDQSKETRNINSNLNKTANEAPRDTKPSTTTSRIAEKYGLRPRTIIKRIQIERTRQESVPEKEPRKSKAPPLSKYRRKTANARERHRMSEINEAFATLRGILPEHNIRRQTAGLTKITTLKMAASYIQSLSDVLNDVSDCSMSVHSGHPTRPPNSDSFFPEGGKPFSEGCGAGSGDFHTSYPSSRGSLCSNSDLSDLLSDESCVLDDNLDAFDDIPSLQSEQDPFGLLLTGDQMDIVLQT